MGRRAVLVTMCLAWLAITLACTGAATRLFDVPGGFYLFQTDHHDYRLFQSVGPNAGGIGFVDGHITHVGFDARHVLLRRDAAEYPTHTQYRLTGRIEFWIVDVAA